LQLHLNLRPDEFVQYIEVILVCAWLEYVSYFHNNVGIFIIREEVLKGFEVKAHLHWTFVEINGHQSEFL